MAEDNSETRGPNWWENATATQVSEVLTQWWDNVVDGPVRNSLGYEDADDLAVWLQRNGVDPQKWLDVNSWLHGDGHTGCEPPSRDNGGLDEIDVIDAIMPLRWIVLYVRRLAKDDTGAPGKRPRTYRNRQRASDCPKCEGAGRVTSSGKKGGSVRHLTCKDCGHNYKDMKSSTQHV